MELHLRIPIRRLFVIDKRFKTKSVLTDRTVKVADAFGIGIEEEEERSFPVFQDFRLRIDPGDIVYITGESGGGKSVLLKELRASMEKAPEFGKVLADWELQASISPDEVLIEGVGKDAKEAMELLSLSGLGEPFLWLRRYGELSDGQKYRYKIAKMMASGASTWLFDEFAATLDRETAKVVAFSLQKAARRTGRTVVVATTHTDLEEDLAPSVYVVKPFYGEPIVSYRPNVPKASCSLMASVRIEEGSLKDYEALARFHYRGGRVAGVRKVFKAVNARGEVLGAIVYTASYPNLKGRRIALGRSLKIDETNRLVSRISRVVVHPKYRGIGLGVRLVKETLPKAGTPIIEALAVMAAYNPFFEKAGMLRVPYEAEAYDAKLRGLLAPLGFDPKLQGSLGYCKAFLRRLKAEKPEAFRGLLEALRRHEWGTRGLRNLRQAQKELGLPGSPEEPSLELMAKWLRLARTYETVYLIWMQPGAETIRKGLRK